MLKSKVCVTYLHLRQLAERLRTQAEMDRRKDFAALSRNFPKLKFLIFAGQSLLFHLFGNKTGGKIMRMLSVLTQSGVENFRAKNTLKVSNLVLWSRWRRRKSSDSSLRFSIKPRTHCEEHISLWGTEQISARVAKSRAIWTHMTFKM